MKKMTIGSTTWAVSLEKKMYGFPQIRKAKFSRVAFLFDLLAKMHYLLTI
jgi:hypothetical protein